MSNNRALIFSILTAATLLAGIFFWSLFYPREVSKWETIISTAEGLTLKADFLYSNTKQLGHADLFLIGGSSPKYEVHLSSKNVTPILWRSEVRPVVINIIGGRTYVVTLGRRKDSVETAFACSVLSNGIWSELNIPDIPPKIAVSNCGFPDSEIDVMHRISQREYLLSVEFRRSITARLWFCIERGKNYSDVYNVTIPEEFVLDFYEKNIKG